MSAPVADGVLAGCHTVGIPLLTAAHELEARHRVIGAADTAALAAADALLGWVQGDPCALAAEVARAADATLVTCELTGTTATVTVSASSTFGTLQVTSRAGVGLDDLAGSSLSAGVGEFV